MSIGCVGKLSLVLTGRIGVSSMMNTCESQAVTSMQNLCYINVTIMWHKCYIHARRVTSLRRWYDTDVTQIFIPSMNCAAEEDSFLFVISTITMLFICTSYTVNFISFKQIYFINICLLTCFNFDDICAINICSSAFVWPHHSRRANILHCWQTWCQNANSAPSKEIYQISGLHTRYRFSLEGSASKKPEAGTRTRPGSYFFG